MVYWVIAKEPGSSSERSGSDRTVERLGPFESRDVADQARERVVGRYRNRPQARIEIVCDFS
ncbi:MAG: hypothetical protein AB7I59_03925 [Geminicoccaceae bacterium]